MSQHFKITTPDQFKKVPWKNGLGHTLELAMSQDGTIEDFDWRLSLATVSNNGIFSDFSGYLRHLVLIKGEGISLTHDDQRVDDLNHLLAFACFDGGSKTVSRLHHGTIDDFNVMTNPEKYQVDVSTFEEVSQLNFTINERAFVYSLEDGAIVQHKGSQDSVSIDKHHLLEISAEQTLETSNIFCFTGKMAIIVKLKRIDL